MPVKPDIVRLSESEREALREVSQTQKGSA